MPSPRLLRRFFQLFPPHFPCTKGRRFDILIIMKLYYCSIAELSDLCGAEYLSPGRRERMSRFRQPEDRARCLAAGLLLRAVLGEEACGRILQAPCGKPYLPGGAFFNLSHSGDYVVLAVSPSETGADVERVAPYPESIAKKCFTAAELKWLSGQGCDRAFFKLWTGKESVMKATGLGFHMPPESFQILPMSDGAHRIAGKDWFLRWLALPGHEVCVATATEQPMQVLPLGRAELLGESPWNG